MSDPEDDRKDTKHNAEIADESSTFDRREYLKLTGGVAALVGGATLPSSTASAAVSEGGPANQSDWTLTFEDDFEGDSLDSDSWGVGWGWGTGTTMSPTRVVERNVDVRDSTLFLKGTHDGDQPYAGGVNTKNKVTFGPGTYYEAKIRFARREGFQNAFWSKPNTEAWPPEIDVVELMQDGSGRDDTHRSRHHVHYSTSTEPGDNSTHVGPGGGYTPGDDLTENFHIYAVEWQEDRITHYVDGEVAWETTDDTTMRAMSNGGPHYMMFSLNIDNVGTPDYSASWGEEVAVDWVRVWQDGNTGGSVGSTDESESSADSADDDAEHYLWARSGDGDTVSFAFEASGGNVRIDPADTEENYWVAEEGAVGGATTDKTSSLPGIRYAGEITDLRYEGDLDLFVDDAAVDPDSLVDDSEPGPFDPSDGSGDSSDSDSEDSGSDDSDSSDSDDSDSDASSNLPNTVTVDGTGSDGAVSYRLSVTGALAETDSITSEDSLSGTTATGAVGAGSDTYRFEGEVTELSLDGSVDVYVNETRVDSVVVRRDADSDGTVRYLLETDGTLIRGETADARATSDDDLDGAKALGAVSDDSDAYWLFGGELLDVSTFGGGVVTTVNGDEASVGR